MNDSKTQKQLITAQELSKVLNVPKSWIYDRTRQGHDAIPFIKLGAYVRFDADEVISFFKMHGDKSIINHRNTETRSDNESTHHDGSREQIRDIHYLSAQTTAGGSDQGETSPPHQKNLRLAHKRTLHKEVSPHKKEARTPQEERLINCPEFGIISSSQGGTSNGGI